MSETNALELFLIRSAAIHTLAWFEASKILAESTQSIPANQVERLHRMQDLHMVVSAIADGYYAAFYHVVKNSVENEREKMSKKTKAKRAEKEAKRLASRYISPVKPKPREMLWVRYARTGLRYEPYETAAQVKARQENAEKASQQDEENDLVDAGT